MNIFSEIRDVVLSPYFGLFVFGAIVFAIAFFQKGRMKESQVSPATIAVVLVAFLVLVAAIPAYQWLSIPPEEPIGTESNAVPAPPVGSPSKRDGDSGKKGAGPGKKGGDSGKKDADSEKKDADSEKKGGGLPSQSDTPTK